MVKENLEEIKKLSPEQRIERLRVFQEKQKQESAIVALKQVCAWFAGIGWNESAPGNF